MCGLSTGGEWANGTDNGFQVIPWYIPFKHSLKNPTGSWRHYKNTMADIVQHCMLVCCVYCNALPGLSIMNFDLDIHTDTNTLTHTFVLFMCIMYDVM